MPSPASMRATRINASRSILPCQPQDTQLKNDRGRRQRFRPRSRAASLLTDAAARAGAAIMRHYHGGAEVEARRTTQARSPRPTRRRRRSCSTALQRLAPDIPVVSEEMCRRPLAPLGPRFFLVDPLDGTKEFIQKRSDFTVNIALVEDGLPRFGLVYAPARVAARHHVRSRQGNRGRASSRASVARTSPRSTAGPRMCACPARRAVSSPWSATPISIRPPRPSSPSSRSLSRSDAGSALKFLAGRPRRRRRLSALRPDHGVGHGGRPRDLIAAGGHVEDAEGKPLRYGKTETGLRNPGFVAWGQRAGR